MAEDGAVPPSDRIPPQRARRQERFFQQADRRAAERRYYRAREGIFGPFESRAMAESDLAELIFRNAWRRGERPDQAGC